MPFFPSNHKGSNFGCCFYVALYVLIMTWDVRHEQDNIIFISLNESPSVKSKSNGGSVMSFGRIVSISTQVSVFFAAKFSSNFLKVLRLPSSALLFLAAKIWPTAHSLVAKSESKTALNRINSGWAQ